ncbi:MAG: polysaccharide lyase 6 family protein [Ferruginibacter sp.]
MKRLLLLPVCLLLAFTVSAGQILVKNMDELNKANKEAKPGDIIVLQNGNWTNAEIRLDAEGIATAPITFKAQTAGKVIISGHSSLSLGGKYIVVDGLYFTNGYAGNTAVINFRINKNKLANNCRVTNSSIDGFNNPKRMEENNWVLFYGKNNRLDHCSIRDKQNMGVTIAVILDDERSRENFHSIDHNYFGFRIPLGSNGGETIRVGVSQHCEFNSNTNIVDNFFEHCDGETEIVSIKSCSNIISNNLFKECSGSLVLRHGNNNIVENNIFLGNGKDGSGGVRVINKGQWVVSNLFYQLRGSGFRSPLAVMNGVPNSPANRYVAAQDAVIANNTWYDCETLSFCEGSDAERSEIPRNVFFINNIVYRNNESDIYKSFDAMSGFHFAGNIANTKTTQSLNSGFTKKALLNASVDKTSFPVAGKSTGYAIPDSIQAVAASKLQADISNTPGFSNSRKMAAVLKNAKESCGAKWFSPAKKTGNYFTKVSCKNAGEIVQLLRTSNATHLSIVLTGAEYSFDAPITCNKAISFIAGSKQSIRFSSTKRLPFLFEVKSGTTFSLTSLTLDLSRLDADNFIVAETEGGVQHISLLLQQNSFKGFTGTFFNATKTSVADNIMVTKNSFSNNSGKLFSFTNETDKKGYYNVEKMSIRDNRFDDQKGAVLTMLRGGNDESTMGPRIWFTGNKLNNCSADGPLIDYYGSQYTQEDNNSFSNCNPGRILIRYQDVVKADHFFTNNLLSNSGKIEANEFTRQSNNKQ